VRFRHFQTGAGVLLLMGLAGWARWAMRRAPDAALALACFAITWLPISNLFKLNATVAEHWLYVPSAFLLAAIYATACRARESMVPRWLTAAAAVWLAFFTVQTWRQQSYWQDQRTFVEETARRAGTGPRMLVNLGQLAASEKQLDRALDYYRQALTKDPDLAVAHFNIATVAAQKKDFDTALAELALVEKSPLFSASALLVRANILEAQTGKPQLHLLAQASAEAPRNWDVCRRLPERFLALGQPQNAYGDLMRQNKVRPYRAECWKMIGRILEMKAALAVKAGDPKSLLEAIDMANRAYGEAANCDLRDDEARRKLQELRPPL
jgi:tetratricopeptide (TPR) repeat protein